MTWQQQDADTAAGTKTGGEVFVEAYDTDIELLRRVADVEKRLTDVARAEVKVSCVMFISSSNGIILLCAFRLVINSSDLPSY